MLRQAAGCAGLALLVALAGCDPIDTYRSLNGIAKNDPDPKTALFTQNLAAGEAEPYPNLATVPPPPTRTTSTADRQKLAQSLIADRAQTVALGGHPIPAGGPGNAKAKSAKTAADAAPGVPSGSTAVASNSADPTKTAANAPRSGRRNANDPPEPGPPESSLQMPELPAGPNPEAPRPAPARAVLPAMPPVDRTAGPSPEAMATVTPQAPPLPVMPPIPPPPPPVKAAEPKPMPTVTTVATLDISGPATASANHDHAEIERVAGLYKDKPSSVRVVAYTGAPTSGGSALTSYHAALDRAQAIAKELANAGVPAAKIQTEASPSLDPSAANRVEIRFAQ
jgi:hypothetical protein